MREIELTALDWWVVAGYLALSALVGLLASLHVKDTAHYFLGSRRFGKLLMIGQSFSTGTHADMPVSLAGAVYSVGLSGIWYQWKNMFATPFYWLIAPLFRRIRRTTVAEMVEDRYGPWMGAFYTLFALAYFTVNAASMLKGAAKVISQAAGGKVPVNEIVVAMTAVFILYSFIGGLVATAWNDILQGFLIIALSFLLIPLGWGTIQGTAGLRGALAPHKLSLTTPQGIGVWFIFMLTINGLVGIVAQPHLMATVGTGRDEDTCRVGFLYGTFVKRFCTIGWALVGLMVAALVARGVFGVYRLGDPEEAFGFACRHLLFPGSLGLLIACVLAANMAACSAFMVDSGALFTRNFYGRYLAPRRTDRHYLWAGRISGAAITLAAVLYALFLIQRVLYSFLLTETMATFVGISVMAGMFWKRANRWGAIASIAAAAATNFLLHYAGGQRLDHWDPDVFFVAMVAGVLALVLVSSLTSPEPPEALASFYSRLQRPSSAHRETPENLDDRTVAEQGRQLILVNLLRLREAAAGLPPWRAYRTDLRGFAMGWLIAGALILLVWIVVHV